MNETLVEIRLLDRRCPRCGAKLCTDSKHEWCSQHEPPPPPGQKACDYGIAEVIPLGGGEGLDGTVR